MKNIEDFKYHVDLYSADLSLWPVDKVKGAISFMQGSVEAKKYFDDMVTVEGKLRAYADNVVISPSLAARIMAEIEGAPVEQKVSLPLISKKTFHWRPQKFLAPGGGLLAVFLVATFIGIAPPENLDYVMKKTAVQATVIDADYLPFIWEESDQ